MVMNCDWHDLKVLLFTAHDLSHHLTLFYMVQVD